MFETDLVLWLQSFASEQLTAFMLFVTEIGYSRYYVALAILITFGVSFRVGFVLFQMVLWNGVFTDLLKNAFALPRPSDVDSAVQMLGQDTLNTAPFKEADGDHFLDLPKAEVIEHYRSHPAGSYGLPSGHVSMATTFWMGAAVLLRSRALSVLGMMSVLLMALSRMYLGRHFLADVLGGFVLGILVVLSFRLIFGPQRRELPYIAREARPSISRSWHLGATLSSLVLVPLLLLALPRHIDFDSAGRLVGANVAFALLLIRGLPAARHDMRCRVARVALALLLYFVTAIAVESFVRRLGLEENAWGRFLDASIPPLVFLIGTVRIGSLLGLYEPARTGGSVVEA